MQDWRDNWVILVPVDSQKLLPIKRGQKFKLKLEDKLQVNPRHSIHYTLSWIACVDDYCNIHYILKTKHGRYPRKIKWNDSEKKFQDTKVMHRWYPSAAQNPRYLAVKPERFMTEECLSGCQWWKCTENYCLWHVQDKINKKYWLKVKQLGKGEAHRTRESQ